MKYKVIVAHPGRQHSFHTAAALEHNGMLCKYVTTVYDKKSSVPIQLLKHFMPQKEIERIAGRKTVELQDEDVICYCTISGIIEALLNRIDKKRKVYRWWHNLLAARFGRKVAFLAIKEHADAVLMYDTTSKECFEVLAKRAPEIVRVMDCSAANRLYMRQVYYDDTKISPAFAQRMMRERGHLLNNHYCNFLVKEIKATELFLSPSKFVQKSLRYSGVESEKIAICPYGTNFSPILLYREPEESQPLQVLYVGNATAMKGIHYLLQAAERLRGRIQLTVVGSFDNSDHIFDQYFTYCNFVGRVPHKEVQTYLRKAEVFVFPSLGEGLSLSVLEAMAYSLPCIVSENSGANDALEDGINGFIIKPQCVEAIEEKLIWCCENRKKLPQMGRKAAEAVGQYTWETYEKRLTSILNDYLNKRDTK